MGESGGHAEKTEATESQAKQMSFMSPYRRHASQPSVPRASCRPAFASARRSFARINSTRISVAISYRIVSCCIARSLACSSFHAPSNRSKSKSLAMNQNIAILPSGDPRRRLLACHSENLASPHCVRRGILHKRVDEILETSPSPHR